MPDRFVILHHQSPDGEHWDLMVERGEVLLTWQLLKDPHDPANDPLPAQRIGDHRKRYLTYEGPLSQGRGTVRRVDEGTVLEWEPSEDGFAWTLRGRVLDGRYRLERGALTCVSHGAGE